MTTHYFSVDIEADGPIPGPYSMLSFGAALCGRFDDNGFTPIDPTGLTFYRELRPISDDFVPEALEVGGLDRQHLATHGSDPLAAMSDFRAWVGEVSAGGKPVVVAYPACYDWMFLYWYLIRFGGDSPFGHSRVMDMKTMFAVKAQRPITAVSKRRMPKELMSQRPHTHHALDDAIEQGELFANLMQWQGAVE